MNGGIRYTNLPNGRTQIPSSTKRFCIHAMSTGFFVSITPMAPSTRTSVTCGNRRAGSSSSCSCRLMRVTLPCQSYSGEVSSFTEAHATAHASGFPIKVGPCINTSGVWLEMVSATSFVVSTADSVMYPPVMAFPMHMMSGSTPACSQAKSFPVRPKPVAISSNISSRPCSLHICTASRRYWGW